MTFLPTRDLESASLFNPTWEAEALKHLLTRNPVDLILHAVYSSTDLVPFSAVCSKHIKILTRPNYFLEIEGLFMLSECLILASQWQAPTI